MSVQVEKFEANPALVLFETNYTSTSIASLLRERKDLTAFAKIND